MEESEKLLVLAGSPTLYEFLNGGPISSNHRLFYHSKAEDPAGFIRENGIRTVILEADELPEADFGLIGRLRKADPLLSIIVISPPGPPDEFMDWIHQG